MVFDSARACLATAEHSALVGHGTIAAHIRIGSLDFLAVKISFRTPVATGKVFFTHEKLAVSREELMRGEEEPLFNSAYKNACGKHGFRGYRIPV